MNVNCKRKCKKTHTYTNIVAMDTPFILVEGGFKNPWRIGSGNLPLEENLKNHKALKRLLINVFVKNKINYN